MSLRHVDFLRPARVPLSGIVLLVAGVVAWAAALAVQQRWVSEQVAVDRAVAAADEADRMRRLPPTAPAPPTAQVRRLHRAQLEHARPWMSALRAVESATHDPIYLTALSADAKTGIFKLEGEAPSFEHALAYVQVLPDGAGLVSAQLTSHEPRQDVAGVSQALRFAASARWGREP